MAKRDPSEDGYVEVGSAEYVAAIAARLRDIENTLATMRNEVRRLSQDLDGHSRFLERGSGHGPKVGK